MYGYIDLTLKIIQRRQGSFYAKGVQVYSKELRDRTGVIDSTYKCHYFWCVCVFSNSLFNFLFSMKVIVSTKGEKGVLQNSRKWDSFGIFHSFSLQYVIKRFIL